MDSVLERASTRGEITVPAWEGDTGKNSSSGQGAKGLNAESHAHRGSLRIGSLPENTIPRSFYPRVRISTTRPTSARQRPIGSISSLQRKLAGGSGESPLNEVRSFLYSSSAGS